MKLGIHRCMAIGAMLASVVLASTANAGVSLGGTRVIYPAKSREVTLQMINEGKQPSLVQSWIDNGDPNALPEDINVPFTLTPPIARVDGGKGQALRIVYTGEALPQDRESVFWLNVLDIPPSDQEAADRNQLQLAFRTRIKLFYRPAQLTGDAAEIHRQVSWSLVEGKGGAMVLRASNTSGYYLSLSKLTLVAGKTVDLVAEMVPPKATRDFALPAGRPVGTVSVTYQSVNDYGATEDHTASLTQ